jgi:hypothetical protein
LFKVKGIWWSKPSDWPDDIPFCDPNNSKLATSVGSYSKPKKETLIQMFDFLMIKYNVSCSMNSLLWYLFCFIFLQRNILQDQTSGEIMIKVANTILNALNATVVVESPMSDEMTPSDNLKMLASVVTAREEPKGSILGRRPSSEPMVQSEPKCLKVSSPSMHLPLGKPLEQTLNRTKVMVVGPPSHLLRPKGRCLDSPPLPKAQTSVNLQAPQAQNLSRQAITEKEDGWDLSLGSKVEIQDTTKMSVEVQDDEEDAEDWDPVASVWDSIMNKVRVLQEMKTMPKRDMGQIFMVKGWLLVTALGSV